MINAILGRKILATSQKIDTTTENIRAISTVGETQVINYFCYLFIYYLIYILSIDSTFLNK